MEIYQFAVTIVTTSLFASAFCYSYNDSIQLMSDMLTGYDKRHRPSLNQSEPTTVNITSYLVSIPEFDEVKQFFSTFIVLRLGWQDELIVWNPASYGGINQQFYKLKDIWYPSLTLVNPYDETSESGKDWMSIKILSNGKAYSSTHLNLISTCRFDVTFYPFDTQECKQEFTPSATSASEVILNSVKPSVSLEAYTENGGWTLSDTSVEVIYDFVLTITYTLKRKPMFYVVNIILPISFLSLINALVFILPPESGERISFSVTILLSLSVFLTLVGDNLPKTSESMSILSYYLMFSLVMSALICVVVILNLRIYFKTPDIPIPAWCVSATHVVKCKCGTKTGDIDCDDMISTTGENGDVVRINTRKASLPGDVPDINHKHNIDIKWREVSSAVDIVCLLFFMVLITTATVSYIGILWLNA